MSLDHAIVSLYAVDTRDGKVIFEENSNQSMIPASCMKLMTTGAAFHLLGKDHRFETHLAYDGFIDQEKALQGNLYIQGGGDPCLGSDRFGLSWDNQISLWVEEILKLGIKKIQGKVIGDDSRWEKAKAVPSWAFEDLGNYYGAGASALTFHENSYSLVFKPGHEEGKKGELIRIEPFIPLEFFSEVTTGPQGSGDQACIFGSELSNQCYIRGTVPKESGEFVIKGSIPDPASYVSFLLREKLQEVGIGVEGKGGKEGKRTIFYTSYSPTVEEIVFWTNQKSINLYAEHLLKAMGESAWGQGSTTAGIKAVRDFWKNQGIDLEGCYMADGSGLSRKNFLTAKQLVHILASLKEQEFFPFFFGSLPKQRERIYAKSGSMSHIRAYAGYAKDAVFAILINHYTSQKGMEEKIDHFFSLLVD